MEGLSQFSPESVGGPFSFNIGDERFGFEGNFTKGEFVGKIRGGDGKEFTGSVEDLGRGRYRIVAFDGDRGEIESPAEAGPVVAEALAAAPAEIPAGGLEDAAALVAMDAAVEPKQAPVEAVVQAIAELPAEAAGPTPVAEPEAVQTVAPEPEQIQMPASKSEDSTELSSAHPTIRDTVSRLQEIRREVAPQAEEAKRFVAVEEEAKNLRRQAEKVRGSISRLRSKDRISERIAEEGALIRQAKELEDKAGIARSQDKYKEMDEHKAWRLEARKDATVALEADLKQWETVMKDPEDFNFYRQVFEKWQKERGKTGSLTDQVDQKFRPLLDEFGQRLPRRLLELAGFVNPRPDGGQKGVDDDIWAIYNQAANQLYSELGGQPAAVTELPAKPEQDQVLPAEQVTEVQLPAEAKQAPEQTVELPTEIVLPATAVEEAPAAEDETAPEPMEAPVGAAIPGQVVVDAAELARAAAAKPAEEPGPRVALNLSGDKPSLKIDKSEVGFGTVDGLRRSLEEQAAGGTMIPNLSPEEANEVLERLNAMQQSASITAPMPDTSGAGIPAAPAETLSPPEAAAEMPEQRFDRRKRGFAGAMAELDQVKNDISGTEGEQKVRLAEAYNRAIGAAMEFMEEGDVAKEVVKGFFAGALGTPIGQKMTEIAVGDRLDQAGVTGAPTGEKKKKLEEAGLLGLLELLLELGMNFTDKTIGAVVTEVQSATGGGK